MCCTKKKKCHVIIINIIITITINIIINNTVIAIIINITIITVTITIVKELTPKSKICFNI